MGLEWHLQKVQGITLRICHKLQCLLETGLWEYLLPLHKVEKCLKPISVHPESLMNQDPGNSFASLECQ